MNQSLNTTRFSVSVKIKEKEEIHDYTSKTGVTQNELIRRASLAYIRKQEGYEGTIEELFQAVGPIDDQDT